MMFLIDTDIIIYSLKRHPEVISGFGAHARDPKAISVVTYGELLYGANRSRRRVENEAKVRRIGELFPVVGISMAIMDTFASVKASLAGKGKVVDDFDLLIGSTALVLNYTLVTNNQKHFAKIPGLKTENWSNPRHSSR